MMGSKSRDQ